MPAGIRAVEQRHQTRKRLDLSGDKCAEDDLLLSEDHGAPFHGFVGQKALADRRIGEALQLPRKARVIEHMAQRPKHLVERLEVQRVGVGQRAVDVEQQRPARHLPPRLPFGLDHFRTFPNARCINAKHVSMQP